MINYLRKLVPLDSPIRLTYHFGRAYIANVLNGFPGRENITIIGVTGTNGKTTTTNIIAKSLKKSGKKVFMFSTVNYMIGDEEGVNFTKMTSPDVFVMQKMLREAVNKGCEYAVIETSSHSLAMHRCFGIEYDYAVLTNITQDHLDLHRTMKNYINTKLKLFSGLIGNKRKPGVKKTAIINGDIRESKIFLEQTYDKELTYGFDETAGLRAANVEYLFDGMKFDIKIPGETLKIQTKLIGKFNIYNILSAVGILLSSGISPREIEKCITGVEYIPGRMEEVKNENGYKIFIDYAHTEDALENVLETVKGINGVRKIITVFGATGDRDKTKRPKMGRVVSQNSDVVILTQDDDYSEDTMSIIKDVIPGIDRKQGDDFYIISDRKDAIRQALIVAEKGDVIVIAGKGDENTMITNAGAIKWHDKKITESLLKDFEDNKIIKK